MSDSDVCSLLPGRCAVCGNPCIACHQGTEVCGGCAVAVRAFSQADGWTLAAEHEDGSTYIECDSSVLFPDDEAAGVYVVARIAPPIATESEATALSVDDAEAIFEVPEGVASTR